MNAGYIKNYLFSAASHPPIPETALSVDEIKSEAIRKSLHFLIALSPSLANINRRLALFLLIIGTVSYSYMEYLRKSGIVIPVISRATALASRSREKGRFVLGPITLGLGAFLAILLFPPPAATVAIYALAFGDGFASIIGKLFGEIRPRFLLGKSIEGSSACFVAVFLAAFCVYSDYRIALLAAVVATLVEALPLKDLDNLALPLSVGFVIQLIL